MPSVQSAHWSVVWSGKWHSEHDSSARTTVAAMMEGAKSFQEPAVDRTAGHMRATRPLDVCVIDESRSGHVLPYHR